MRNTSQEKWQKVTHISISCALVVSLIFALVGYGTFTGLVQGTYIQINPTRWVKYQVSVAHFLTNFLYFFCLQVISWKTTAGMTIL